MMAKKKLWHEEDDTLMSQVKYEQEQYEDVIDGKYKGWDATGNGIPMHGPLAAGGRQCMRCSGQLFVKERTENETLIVFCKNCGAEFHEPDLDKSESTDAMYRSIPDDMVLRYTEARLRQKGNLPSD